MKLSMPIRTTLAMLAFALSGTQASAEGVLPLKLGTYVNPTNYYAGFGPKVPKQTCAQHDSTFEYDGKQIREFFTGGDKKGQIWVRQITSLQSAPGVVRYREKMTTLFPNGSHDIENDLGFATPLQFQANGDGFLWGDAKVPYIWCGNELTPFPPAWLSTILKDVRKGVPIPAKAPGKGKQWVTALPITTGAYRAVDPQSGIDFPCGGSPVGRWIVEPTGYLCEGSNSRKLMVFQSVLQIGPHKFEVKTPESDYPWEVEIKSPSVFTMSAGENDFTMTLLSGGNPTSAPKQNPATSSAPLPISTPRKDARFPGLVGYSGEDCHGLPLPAVPTPPEAVHEGCVVYGDLNGDGAPEAFIFYSDDRNGTAEIYTKNGAGWAQLASVPGNGFLWKAPKPATGWPALTIPRICDDANGRGPYGCKGMIAFNGERYLEK